MKSSRKRNVGNILTWIGYIIVIIFFLFPIFWVISLSFKPPQEVFSYPPTLLPNNPTFGNYIQVMEMTLMPTYLWNSTRLVIYTVIGTLLASIPASYAFSRFNFKNKDIILFLILMFQMISPVIIGIPLYKYFGRLGLLNNYFGLAMVYISTQIPFTTFLLKGGFDSIPKELDEAAEIDGASRLQILVRVVLPLSLPILASSIIFISINAWSQFIIPFLLVDQQNAYPVSVGILMAQGTFQEVSIQYVAAASVLALLPAVLLVLILQKFILNAMIAGALKG